MIEINMQTFFILLGVIGAIMLVISIRGLVTVLIIDPHKSKSHNKNSISDVLYQCSDKSIVAFKSKEKEEWYTGYIHSMRSPECRHNKTGDWFITIYIYEPVSPPFYQDYDKTTYFLEDIEDIILIQK